MSHGLLPHEHYMRRAIELGKQVPRFPFGAVIADGASGKVVAEGWNRGRENPIWHGEIDALNQLAAGGWSGDRQGLALYTTAEPCPMCQSAILWASLGLVVFGTSIRTLQQLGWNQIDILSSEVASRAPFSECQIIGGVLATECDPLFQAALAP